MIFPGEGEERGRIAKEAGMGSQVPLGHKGQGENTPIESLLDVLGIRNTKKEREKERISCAGRATSPCLIPAIKTDKQGARKSTSRPSLTMHPSQSSCASAHLTSHPAEPRNRIFNLSKLIVTV